MQGPIPSPYYRVAVKGLIFNDENKVLMARAADGRWEIPGGGWEHDETIEECFAREIQEELGVHVVDMSQLEFIFRGVNLEKGRYVLRLMVRATLDSHNFMPGDGIVAAKFVDAEELKMLPFVPGDANIVDYIDKIWV